MPLCKDGYWREWGSYEGKQYCGSIKYDGEDDKCRKTALIKLGQKLKDAENGVTSLNGNMTVKAWAKTWLETYVKDTDITDKSYKNIKSKVECNVVDKIGAKKLCEIKEAHLQNILNSQKGKSISHVDKLRQYMKRMFGKAVKSKLIASNPADDLELPKASSKSHRPITATERTAILKVAETHPSGLWVKTMLYCGLRPGETVPLQWKDIDFKNKTINVHQALESGTRDIYKGPKSDAGYRLVPIPDHLVPAFAAKKGAPLDYIFTQLKKANRKTPLTTSSLRSHWNSFKKALDKSLGAKTKNGKVIESMLADDLVPYCLRHTYCTDLQDFGVEINVAKYLMGHSDIAITANIYTHESDVMLQQAAEKINAGTTKDTTEQKHKRRDA